MIVKILKAEIVKYRDNKQTIAYVGWEDHDGKTGTTTGDPKGLHMSELIRRARREGVPVRRDTRGWLPS